MKLNTLFGFLILVILPRLAYADKISVPDEELAHESVLPVFETPESVKDRNVPTEKSFELGGYYGWNTTQPIYNQSKYGLNIGYHWSETSAVVLNLAKWMGGLNTQYTDQIERIGAVDFTRIPQIQYSAYLDYEWELYYGKISLTKRGVMNMFIYPLVGLGGTDYVNKFYPGVNFGIGQKFFFTKYFALRADLKLQYEDGPNPFLGNGQLSTSSPTLPAASAFSDKWVLGTILDVGLTFLF